MLLGGVIAEGMPDPLGRFELREVAGRCWNDCNYGQHTAPHVMTLPIKKSNKHVPVTNNRVKVKESRLLCGALTCGCHKKNTARLFALITLYKIHIVKVNQTIPAIVSKNGSIPEFYIASWEFGLMLEGGYLRCRG